MVAKLLLWENHKANLLLLPVKECVFFKFSVGLIGRGDPASA